MTRIEPGAFLRGLLPLADWDEHSRLPAVANLKLPIDTVRAGRVPAGVRLAFTGTARAIDIEVVVGARTSVPAPTLQEGFFARTPGAESTYTPLPADGGAVRVLLPVRDPAQVVTVFLPEAFETTILSLSPVDGDIAPAPRGRRWVAYGDSITQGWSVSEPGLAWPTLIADELGIDLINLGFAGSGRGELLAADAIATSGADAVVIAWGTNSWSSLPSDAAQVAEQMRIFLTALRSGLPQAPLVVVSPIVRPEAEQTANRFGITHADFRIAIESAVERFIKQTHDQHIILVPGRELVPADQLVDGIHPGDAGHASFAAGLLPHVAAGFGLTAD